MPKLKCKFILTSLFLITIPAINYGVEEFIEADFLFDKNTRLYKNIIITGVNKIHKENSRSKVSTQLQLIFQAARGQNIILCFL